MQQEVSERASESLLSELVDSDCQWCSTGTLERGVFKGDDAAVCENCGTPAARVW